MKELSCSSRDGKAVLNDNDTWLEGRVVQLLLGQHFKKVQELDVRVLKGVVTIFGTVDSFYEKQIAVSICRQVVGLRRLIDKIDVDYLQNKRVSNSFRTQSLLNRPR